ncbi:F-box/LRR-repeat protein At3g59190-like isoform X3 [Silene latifolia]|uniref:F-box/LRR-repeat protein At3g59190-like isoform X3 n=1 Tax=Silene latifolia TaxID=37657 RepID=UPI003D76FA83
MYTGLLEHGYALFQHIFYSGKTPVKTMRRPKKPRKHRGGNSLDRISSLPDDVLGHILSFLPTRSAVSTSILSTKWQRLFTLTTCLSFDDAPCFDHPKENERIEATRRFKEFVDKVLELHQISPIKKFSLVSHATITPDGSDLKRWFTNALRKGVQELYYWLDRMPYYNTFDHDDFFMCETLVSLKMIGREYHNIKVPLSASLPKLKILHLGLVIFFDFNSVERLFSSCELLEELTLSYCVCTTGGHVNMCTRILKVLTIEYCSFSPGTFEIDARNLAYLTYKSNMGVRIIPSWKYSCSLVKAELSFGINEDSRHCERELLKAAAYKVAELQFEVDSAQGFPCCINSSYDCPDYCYGGLLPPSDIPLEPFSCRVNVIEVYEFCGDKGPLLLMGHLLRNASVLKSLIVSTVCDINQEEELRICKELLMLPRVSRDCCVKMNKGNKSLYYIPIPCRT